MRLRTTLFVALITLSLTLNASTSAEVKRAESAGWLKQRWDGFSEWVSKPANALLTGTAAFVAAWGTSKALKPQAPKSKAPKTPVKAELISTEGRDQQSGTQRLTSAVASGTTKTHTSRAAPVSSGSGTPTVGATAPITPAPKSLATQIRDQVRVLNDAVKAVDGAATQAAVQRLNDLIPSTLDSSTRPEVLRAATALGSAGRKAGLSLDARRLAESTALSLGRL